jgi:hypothetical protein
MSLIKKIDVPRHFAARRAMRRAGVQFTRPPLATVIAEVKTVDTDSNAHGFIEDFSLEHSSPRAPVTPME